METKVGMNKKTEKNNFEQETKLIRSRVSSVTKKNIVEELCLESGIVWAEDTGHWM